MPKMQGIWSVVAAASVGMSVASVARGQACNQNIGPAVTVGDITGPSNYVATGGLDAFSLGTYSCNLGDVWVNWFSSTTQHPVVGQNMFKLKKAAGTNYYTFDHLGQSWLKHTFLALSNTLCCPNCSATSGTHLGVGCADPYTSGRNGSQGGLGPKWQVNAHTGAFAYPYASPGFQNSANVARRLIVPTSDLEVGSATVKYVVDCQYVSPDCATAGNQNLASSYRPANVTGGPTEFNLSLTGSTVRTQPAIWYWKSVEPGATIVNLDVPAVPSGTERFIVGSKATDNGNGTWHYEFVVYNQNADQNAGTFAVPLPDTATISNVGFHGVSYRDGDGINNVNFDSTPWSMARSNNTISWSTTPFAQNANANALRWGTMYSFRFDADVAPATSGTVTVTTWKTVADFQANAQVPAVQGSACYANCDQSTAQPILNVNDFVCFQNKFAAGDSYANCDQSTQAPVLNVNDFICFQNSFATGCR